MDDVAVGRVDVRLGVEALDKVVADHVGHGLAHPRHDGHVEHHVDGIGQLNAVLGEGGAHHAHGVGDDVHGAALHGAGVQLFQLGVHLLGIHPVVGGAGVLLLSAADEGAVFHPGHVVLRRAVEVAAGQLLLVELLHLPGGAGLRPQLLQLCLGAVNPNDLVGLGHGRHMVDPLQHGLVLCQCQNDPLLIWKIMKKAAVTGQTQ